MRGGKRSNPLASRIKRVMQADEDVGKIAQATPVLIGHSVELFLDQLCIGAGDLAVSRGDKTLGTGHLKAYVNAEPNMDFLRGLLRDVPDLQDKAPPTPSKRSRAHDDTSDEPSSSGRGRGRGRGPGRAKREAGEPRGAKRAKKVAAGSHTEGAAGSEERKPDLAHSEVPTAEPISAVPELPKDTELKEEPNNAGQPVAVPKLMQNNESGAVESHAAQAPKETEKSQQPAALGVQQAKVDRSEDLNLPNSAAAFPGFASAGAAGGGLEDEDDYDADE